MTKSQSSRCIREKFGLCGSAGFDPDFDPDPDPDPDFDFDAIKFNFYNQSMFIS